MYIHTYIYIHIYIDMHIYTYGFSDSSVGKESACDARDPGLIHRSGRSTREVIGYPL